MTYDRARFIALRRRMSDAGIRFVVASGNQFWQLRSFFEPGDEVAYAAENGHFVYDVGQETPFSAPEPDPEVARAAIAYLEERRLPYLASTVGGSFAPSWLSPEDERWGRTYHHRLTMVDDVLSVADGVIKALLRAEEPHAVGRELDALLGGRLVPVVSGPEDLDLNAPGHNKAVGLASLAARWGLDLADAVAFGDNFNDMEMLRAVGLSVAMSTAPEEVRAAATRIAPPSSADGVLDVLDEILP